MDTASEYGQGRDISMPGKGAFPWLPSLNLINRWFVCGPPLLGQFPKTIHPLVLELAMKEMGRDDAKKLYTVRNYQKKVVKLGGNRRIRGRRGINSHQISFVLVPSFL